jgi:hypothetical protein
MTESIQTTPAPIETKLPFAASANPRRRPLRVRLDTRQ